MNGCIYRTEDNKCEFWSDHGKGIVSYCDFDDCEEKNPSNADRIRAMSDEELADWFIKIQNDVADYYDGGYTVAPELPTMKNSWLDWLKKKEGE